MAKKISTEECIERHKTYPIDVWKESMNDLQTTRLQRLNSLIPPNVRVLDIGCNSGYIANLTKGKMCDCYGVDVSPELVKKASKKIKAQIAPAENLPFEDNFFDVSILGEILEHVFDAEVVVKEAVRVTKSLVIGSTPHERGNWGEKGMHPVEDHKFHVRCYNEHGLSEMLKKFGIPEIEVLFDRHNRPQMYIFALDVAEVNLT